MYQNGIGRFAIVFSSTEEVVIRKMNYRFYEVEGIISKMDLSEVEDDIVETDEDMQLVVSGWYVYIPELNMNLREGVVCIWDEEEKLFMPDFAVTVIYEGDIENKYSRIGDSVVNELGESTQASFPANSLYYEQDGFVVTLDNWLNGRLPVDQIEQLRCEIVIPQRDAVANSN